MPKNSCENCGNEIQVAIFKGGRWCSDDCRKALEKKDDSVKADAGVKEVVE